MYSFSSLDSLWGEAYFSLDDGYLARHFAPGLGWLSLVCSFKALESNVCFFLALLSMDFFL